MDIQQQHKLLPGLPGPRSAGQARLNGAREETGAMMISMVFPHVIAPA